jgi:hypothetical protein
MEPWELVFHGPTLEFLLARKSSVRVQLLKFCDCLSANPYLESDYTESDSTGRTLFCRVVGDWAITYWRDDLVKEIRIVKIEPA